MRPNEVNGVDYHFLSTEDFKKHINNNDFVEWEEVYDNMFYGTLKSEINRIWQSGKNVIFDVDVKGGLSLTNYFGTNALAIFVQPPSIKVLEERLRNRGTETEETIQRRIAKADKELEFAKQFNCVVYNDNLEVAQQETYRIIKAFLNK